MPLNKLRCAIYARVSSDPRNVGRSVSEQEHECRAVADREGWEVVATFTDQDRSASRYAKRQRDAYKELVDFVAAGKCEVLCTWEASRFSRDLEAYVSLRELCRKHGVLWSYSGRTFDLSRTDDRLMTGLDALLAERESDVTRERVLRAMRSNAAQGKPHGKRPYGYEREYDPKTGLLLRQVIRESEAALIREAAKRIVGGEPPYRVITDWNARGIKSPRGALWGVSVLKRVLTNPIYIGKRRHKGEVVADGDWQPILDEPTYYKLLAMYGDPERRKFSDPKLKFLLSGIATCGVCGGRIKVARPRGYSSYTCWDKFCVARKVESVDKLITQLVIARLSMPDALAALSQEDDSEVAEKLELISDIRARLNAFYDEAAEGKLTAQAVGRIEARLLVEVQDLERQVRRVGVPGVVFDLAANPALWDGLDISAKRLIVKTLLSVQILPARSGVRIFDPNTVRIEWRYE